ncbi:MAG: zf-HC2 domain-containing protein [Myxococcota bacterium]
MKCRDVVELIDDYVDGELRLARRAQIDWHLRQCLSCARYFESYRMTIVLTREAFSDSSQISEIPEDLVASILAAQKK